jgi:Leucine-rich repeat (LRR) protein
LTKSNFPALKTLDLSSNKLTGEGDFRQFSENLQSIKLSNNNYTSLAFSRHQKQLNHLVASNNQITSVEVAADTYLSHIDLGNNKLAGTQYFFAPENKVRYLDLSFNNISSIGDASVLKQAGTIYLQSNKLTTIGSVKYLWATGKLRYLSLDANACFQCGTLGVNKTTWEQFGCTCDPRTCIVCN